MEHLVDDAERFGLRAPELALVLGERAAALAESACADELWMRAESVVVHARVRLGHRAATAARAVAALRAAEDTGHEAIAARLRTDLAVCARSVGAPLTGLAALRPVLTVGGLSAMQRAAALCHLVGCLGTLGRKAELDRVLLEGDRLVSADDGLDDDTKLLARALIRLSVSSHRRRHGDLVGAADAARTGIGFLDHLEDGNTDPGLAKVRLVLELVCALLDRGDIELALEIAEPVLAEPARAASVAPAGWLRLAVATRVHLQRGAADAAGRMLRDAVHSAGRHGLDALAARLWLELANIEERVGDPAEAIRCLHRARAAEHQHARARSQARAVLTGEFGSGEQAPVDLAEVVASASRTSSIAVVEPKHAPDPAPAARPEPAPAASAAEPAPEQKPVPEPRPEPRPEPAAPAAPATPAVQAAEPETERQARRKVVLPMLRLAPEPEPETETRPTPEPGSAGQPEHAEPRRTRVVAEPEPAEQPAAIAAELEPDPEPEPEPAPSPRAEAQPEPQPEPAPEPQPESPYPPPRERLRTRHDSEHGSVAARSVLDRLGITTGGGGGRRRAAEDADRTEGGHREPAPEVRRASAEMGDMSDASEASMTFARDDDSGPSEPGTGAESTFTGSGFTESDSEAAPSDGYGWLPRLRLPPSLAPLEDFGTDYPDHPGYPEHSGYPDYTASSDSEPEPAGMPELPMDDPPADAGLADLLARALAEHRAGTTSASALVKQLGVEYDEPDGARRVNGRNHNDA